MKTIYKYNLGIPHHNLVCNTTLHKGAKILSAQIQENNLVVWAIVNPKNSMKTKTFYVYVSCLEKEAYDKKHYEYISTVQTSHGLVWHLFEVYED